MFLVEDIKRTSMVVNVDSQQNNNDEGEEKARSNDLSPREFFLLDTMPSPDERE